MRRAPGVVGIGERPFRGRADFDPRQFLELIERGPRFVWERSGLCPCRPLDTATTQPDPNCAKCGGLGFFWFGPPSYDPTATDIVTAIGPLDDVQSAAQARNGGVYIRAYMDEGTSKQEGYDPLVPWARGWATVFVRPENRLGFYDRLVGLDTEIAWAEILKMPAIGLKVVPRYPAIAVTMIEDESHRRYMDESHFRLDKGDIVFHTAALAPAAAVHLMVHYLHHPAWMVMEHPNVLRVTTDLRVKSPPSPSGQRQELPIEARVQLEHEREDLRIAGGRKPD